VCAPQLTNVSLIYYESTRMLTETSNSNWRLWGAYLNKPFPDGYNNDVSKQRSS
jgi:hypothetical protein